MKNNITIIVFGLLLSLFNVEAQERKLKTANQKYEEFAFIDASEIYKEVAESGYRSEELLKRLGNTYYFNADYTKAVKWYDELFSMEDYAAEPQYLLRYAQSLKAEGNEGKAMLYYDQFLTKTGISRNDLASASDYISIIASNSNRYEVEPIGLELKSMSYGTFVHDGYIYFASSKNNAPFKKIDAWSNDTFLDIYKASYDEKENTYGVPEKVKGEINSKYHESTPVITRDGKTMYFTKTNESPKIKKSKKEKTQVKIYRATKVGGEWSKIEDLSINGDNYSNAHPVLSADEKTLYFVSNMPSTMGQTDIFYVQIKDDGSFGVPQNLGPEVNTKGRESFPYITSDNELYFSSDGHFGLGGYDVFYIDLKSQGKELYNLGTPINGASDDFAFSINNRTKKGFLSSNRTGKDAIYCFTEHTPIKEAYKKEVKGVVTDVTTKEPIVNAVIEILDEKNNVIATIETNSEGEFVTAVDSFKNHIVKVSKEGYDSTDTFIPVGVDEEELNLGLTKNEVAVEAESETTDGTNLAEVLHINKIYYDYNSASIRSEAIVELEKIVAVMKKHNRIKVEIRSYSDSRGTAAYNLKLSSQRANSVVNYLVNKGIDRSRLKNRGYGEAQLINDCGNDTPCTEAQHQINRRTEFIIIEK